MENNENKDLVQGDGGVDVQRNSMNEKVLSPRSGWLMLFVIVLMFAAAIAVIVVGIIFDFAALSAAAVVLLILAFILTPGMCVIAPNEAAVYVLFGKYYGTIKKEGFFWINPFCKTFNPASGALSGRKISLKAMTLNNDKQKVNDLEGNPIEIGVVVIWKIEDTAKAVFNVENYERFISIQSDAAIRNIARQYPYDISDGGDEKSLRGSSQEIADMLCAELQKRVEIAGIAVLEARIAHLAYSQEIAAAMLQRQQAKAVVDARTTIVEGAVGMVELALEKLSKTGVVTLDDEQKAKMVSNLMVVLCSNKDTQPIVNSGNFE